jgi:poly-beta-hydroxyalkanoate depolymerase
VLVVFVTATMRSGHMATSVPPLYNYTIQELCDLFPEEESDDVATLVSDEAAAQLCVVVRRSSV